ncbi:MAG: nicotinic acid mononucleotide adenylyltransferase [Legionellales bacterium]|nr:nicotinic acid mononucleotide adenylyltransferase [Legionellales bacterium]|tara:strand:- start:72 stop:716 length:645 start_codon:yes stop_codon:yes gene_type:complete
MPLIGVLGGTFDPIHNGHIRLALEAKEQLSLDHVRLIPLNFPPHRSRPIASSLQRRKMIELAIDNEECLRIDLRELDNDETSYSINTLKSLRYEFIDDTLCLILGRDAFNKIDRWKDWKKLLNYAHIIVANRPGESDEPKAQELKQWIKQHQTNQLTALNEKLCGYIHFINIPMLDISSSLIRKRHIERKVIAQFLSVSTQIYIKENNLYQETV